MHALCREGVIVEVLSEDDKRCRGKPYKIEFGKDVKKGKEGRFHQYGPIPSMGILILGGHGFELGRAPSLPHSCTNLAGIEYVPWLAVTATS